MQFGNYDVDLVQFGRFRMDGGGLFGIVPRKLWLRAYPHVDDDNRVQLATYGLLIRGEGVVLLADTGVGDKIDDKTRGIFAVEQPDNAVESSLAAKGVTPKDVTHFVYTHLHFDHAGGATVHNTEGVAEPLFPNARHYVQREHLAWARNPSDKDRASFHPDNWEPVIAAGLMEELSGDTEILPRIKLRVVNGHTAGLQMIEVRGHGELPAGEPADSALEGLLFAVDLFPTAAHLPPHYVAAFDNEPLLALEEKRRVLDGIANDNFAVAFGHDPFTPAATLIPAPRGYQVAKVLKL